MAAKLIRFAIFNYKEYQHETYLSIHIFANA